MRWLIISNLICIYAVSLSSDVVKGVYSNGFIHPYVHHSVSLSVDTILSVIYSHDLKMFVPILYQGHVLLVFTRVMAPCHFFKIILSLLLSAIAVLIGVKPNLPVIVPMTRRGSHYTEVTLDCLLPESWPFVSFSHFNDRNSCHCNFFFQRNFIKLS